MKNIILKLIYRLFYRFDKTGKIVEVPNLTRKAVINDYYYGVEVLTPCNGKEYLLLTKKEYETGLKRAQKNIVLLPKD